MLTMQIKDQDELNELMLAISYRKSDLRERIRKATEAGDPIYACELKERLDALVALSIRAVY